MLVLFDKTKLKLLNLSYELILKNNYRNTLCHFPPKSDDFTDFCEGGKLQRPTKNFLKNYFEIFI